MGLRKWVSRPLRGHHVGVENLLRGGEGVPVSHITHLELIYMLHLI
jgi:hypothetical protein